MTLEMQSYDAHDHALHDEVHDDTLDDDELEPGERLARDSKVSSLTAPSSGLVRGQNTPPHEETIKALQTQGMNHEFAAWTEASAPPLFDEDNTAP